MVARSTEVNPGGSMTTARKSETIDDHVFNGIRKTILA
jgi:hypothetical protein